MRRQINKRQRNEDQGNRGTHQATTATQPIGGNIPQSIIIINKASRKPTTIPLTPIEMTAIEAQDAIGWDHFIRGLTAKALTPNHKKIKQYD